MSTNTTTCSIRVNANAKRIFDRVCEKIGITPSAAYSIFTNAVAQEQRIPFVVKAGDFNDPGTPEDPLAEARADLEKKGLVRDYTLDEINEIIAEAHNYKYTPEEEKEMEEMLNDVLAQA